MTVGGAIALAGNRFERTLLSRPGSDPDITTRVTWLQGHALYCDLRQPAGMPHIDASSSSVLSIDELLVLAGQDGFGGHLLDRGAHVEWHRTVALHPAVPVPDAGTLDLLDADTVVERGAFEDYTEHWHIAATSPHIDECLLEDIDTGAPGLLIRVGDDFAFARGRVCSLGSAPLTEQIRGAATLRAAQLLFDCEIAVGTIEHEQWKIVRSTLPYRAGAALNPVLGEEITTEDADFDGRPVTRRWRRLDPADAELRRPS